MNKKNVLITGASAGIGKALAEQLLKKGHHVIAIARREERLVELKNQHPKQVQIIAEDVANAAMILEQQMPDQRIDVLVNNAGLALGMESIEAVQKEDWRQMFETNVLALVDLSQWVIRKMLNQGEGDIVNLGSVAGFTAYAGGSIYNATKFAVRGLTEAWRKDLLGKNIRVIGIHPGKVETEFSEVRFRGDKAKAADVYKNMRALTAEDIAESIVWCLERPRHINIDSLMILPTDQVL